MYAVFSYVYITMKTFKNNTYKCLKKKNDWEANQAICVSSEIEKYI